MAPDISPEEMQEYRRTARRWLQEEQHETAARRERAWMLARRAALLLKEEFAVSRVTVFGSLIQEGRFNRWSDLDLAAWGLTSANWLRAIGAVRGLSDEVELNLVDVETCSPGLLAVIEREGVDL